MRRQLQREGGGPLDMVGVAAVILHNERGDTATCSFDDFAWVWPDDEIAGPHIGYEIRWASGGVDWAELPFRPPPRGPALRT